MKYIVVLLLSLVILTGCDNGDDDKWGPNSEGNYTVRVINNLNDDIKIEYKRDPRFDGVEVVTGATVSTYSTEQATVLAHGEKEIEVHFYRWGNGVVTVMWNEREEVYRIPYEGRTISVNPEDFK